MAGLASDQPWPPTRPPPGSTDPLLLGRREQPRATAWTRRAILETDSAQALLGCRLQPPPPPLASRRRRDGVSPPHGTNNQTRHPRPAPAGQRVRDKRYGEAPSGTSFDCEPSQTHSLEGGPDDLLSRPQPVEARHLGSRKVFSTATKLDPFEKNTIWTSRSHRPPGPCIYTRNQSPSLPPAASFTREEARQMVLAPGGAITRSTGWLEQSDRD